MTITVHTQTYYIQRFFIALHMALSHIHTFIVYAQSVIFPNPSPDFIPQKYYHYCTHLISETFFSKAYPILAHGTAPHTHIYRICAAVVFPNPNPNSCHYLTCVHSLSFLFRSTSWIYILDSDDLFLTAPQRKNFTIVQIKRITKQHLINIYAILSFFFFLHSSSHFLFLFLLSSFSLLHKSSCLVNTTRPRFSFPDFDHRSHIKKK
jgi:hypothetical protein